MLTYFQNLYIAEKRMKSATKPIQQRPPHLRHVATLPLKIQILCRYSADMEENLAPCGTDGRLLFSGF